MTKNEKYIMTRDHHLSKEDMDRMQITDVVNFKAPGMMSWEDIDELDTDIKNSYVDRNGLYDKDIYYIYEIRKDFEMKETVLSFIFFSCEIFYEMYMMNDPKTFWKFLERRLN